MPELIKFILLLIASYLIGSIPMAYLVVKWRYGTDLRKHGSGQVGGSNVFRTFSKPWGIMVGLFDAGKGALMVWIAHLLGFGLSFEIGIGLAAIIGHNWPVFLNFNAGRGIATTMGVAFYLFPWGLVAFVAGAVFTLVLGSSPLPVLVGLIALPLASWFLRGQLHLQEPLTLTLGLLAFLLLVIIRRISAPRTARSASIRNRELLFNRFFFDRDIRDGKSWIRSSDKKKTSKKGRP
jgi:acyl phosphate:glycerol-3-phosphate acyltransferase